MDDNKRIPLNEGYMKKGGINPTPSTPKPNFTPPPQKPKPSNTVPKNNK